MAKKLSDDAIRKLAREGKADRKVLQTKPKVDTVKKRKPADPPEITQVKLMGEMLGKIDKSIKLSENMSQAGIELTSGLLTKIQELQQPVAVEPPRVSIEQPATNWVFTVERDRRGFISRVHAKRVTK